MGQLIDTKELVLYRVTDEVLHYMWDPIGVAGIPEARDEYRGYLPQVFSLLQSEANEQQIANLLGEIAGERMGLAPIPLRDMKIAQVLIAWKAAV